MQIVRNRNSQASSLFVVCKKLQDFNAPRFKVQDRPIAKSSGFLHQSFKNFFRKTAFKKIVKRYIYKNILMS